MASQHFSKCPFCERVFEHDGKAYVTAVDGRSRYVCEPCVKRIGLGLEGTTPIPSVDLPAKPNGGLLKLRPADELAAGV